MTFYGAGPHTILIFALLGLSMLYPAYQKMTSINKIAEYITPYNGDMKAKYSGLDYMWRFETKDSKEQITEFYSDNSNYIGWELIRDFPFMTLKKNNKIIRIDINSDPMKNTIISYTLSNAKK